MTRRLLLLTALCLFFFLPALAQARPAKWCGWYMMRVEGVSDRAFYRARHWARYGAPARGPAPGVIVVWRSHVGKIVGQNARGQWLVHSGNDSNAVRTRARSLKGVIAYRWPSRQRFAALR